MSTLATVTARCVHCLWRTDIEGPGLLEARDLHELTHPGGTVLVGAPDLPHEMPTAAKEAEPMATNGAKVRTGAQPWSREEAIAAIQGFISEHGRWPASVDWKGPMGLPSYVTARKLFGTTQAAIAAAGGLAMPPPVANPAEGHDQGRKHQAIEPGPASVNGSDGTSEWTLVALARAVEEADNEWGDALRAQEAAEERFEAAKASLTEAIKVLAERVESG
jgi:hypothetical protein